MEGREWGEATAPDRARPYPGALLCFTLHGLPAVIVAAFRLLL